ncbi:MAG: hypothetical protein RLZZ373_2513 [Pseudomonadota bacterium]|jgi:hypothetical protein
MNTSLKTPRSCPDPALDHLRVRGAAAVLALLACAAPAMSAPTMNPAPPLHCTLRLDPPDPAATVPRLQVEVRNTGTRGMRLLRWGTPFEGAWFAAFVTVTRDGVALPYQGAMVKRGAPRPEDHFTLTAGRTTRAVIAFEPAFDLTAPGRYRVSAAWRWQGWWLPLTGHASGARMPLSPVEAACEALEFTRPATLDRK